MICLISCTQISTSKELFEGFRLSPFLVPLAMLCRSQRIRSYSRFVSTPQRNMSHFRVIEHIVRAQNVRERPGAVKGGHERELIDKASFLAVKVSCGTTFTFGGLTVEPANARLVQSTTGKPLPNVFCVGEMMGGLFYNNYAGGSGLTSGAVFGRRVGDAAAKVALAAKKSQRKPDVKL